MIKLNIQDKSVTGKPVLREYCPNCGSTDYWEKRTSTDDDYNLLESIEDFNQCNSCGTRFDDYGNEQSKTHEMKTILIYIGIFAAVALAAFLFTTVSKYFK